MAELEELVQLLRTAPGSACIRPLAEELERLQPADLSRDAALLAGVWQLRCVETAQFEHDGLT